MVHFTWVDQFPNLRLDIVGIVAVLGEGCTARTIEASALSWHHVLPRFIPAPQALLRHEQARNLPTEEGIVISAYSGNYKGRISFFCRLLHNQALERNAVELCQVTRKSKTRHAQAFGVKRFGPLAWLSLLGCAMAGALLAMSIYYADGFALVATVLLASTSTIVGFASWWNLELKPSPPREDRAKDIPDPDLVIYYPTGAFRIVRCTEEIAQLYFRPEVCNPYVKDNTYRFLALMSSITLMMGLLAMGNSKTQLQIAFAVAYIALNVCYWAISAINPFKYHWSHDFDVKIKHFHDPVPQLPTPFIHKSPSKATAQANFVSEIATHQRAQTPGKDHSSPESAPIASGSGEKRVTIRQRSFHSRVADTGEPTQQPLTQHRRKMHTDLEAFKHRIQEPVRSLTAPLQKTMTDLFHPIQRVIHAPTEPATPAVTEARRFTEALWIAIALTGTSRWLKNSRIAPDTDAWMSWIDLAGRRARSRKNDAGDIIPACTQDRNGVLILPIWNYNGVLKDLLREEDTIKKNAPPDPPTFREVVEWTSGFKLAIRVKLKAWVRRARMNVQLRELRNG